MHEIDDIENKLKEYADRLSKEYNDAPVVILIGGAVKANIPRGMTA